MKKLLLCCAASAVLGGAVESWLADNRTNLASPSYAQELRSPNGAPITNVALPPNPGLTPEELTNVRVYEAANRGVVNVVTKTISRDRFFMMSSESEGAGSGSVLDKRGYVLTNYHVVEDASEVWVTLPGGKEPYRGEIVGQDPENDIAVLKINAPPQELYPVTLGTSDNLRVGQRVYTLGNPFGLEGTLTTGIISNLNRTLPSRSGRDMKSIIQTDAAMNPGNSGGPLLDTGGRMIGMNVAIATKTGQNAGLGFAIPVNRIRQVVSQLIEHGKVVRADIGIVLVKEMDKGLQIVQLNKGGPSERAGLQGWKTVRHRVAHGPIVLERQDSSGADIIVEMDGQPVQTAAGFLEKIEEHQPGERVVPTIIRQGRQMQVPVTLGAS